MNVKPIIGNILAMFLAFFLHACGKDPAALRQRAEAAAAVGDYKTAIIELKSAVQQDADNGELRYMLGRYYNVVFDSVAAAKELRKAKELGVSDGGRVDVELARALRGQGQFDNVLKEITPEETFQPAALASIYALRGRSQHALGLSTDAEASLAAARAAQAGNIDATMLDAQLKAGKRDLEGSLAVLDRLLDQSPDHLDAWSYKAELLRQLHREEDAVSAYGKVLKLNPRNYRALVSRSSLLIGQGKLDQAEKDIATLRAVYKDNPQSHIQFGMLKLAAGRPREALDAAQMALKFDAKRPGSMLLAGLAHHALGSHEQAESYLSAYVAANPGDNFARERLAESLLSVNNAAGALEVIKPALESGVLNGRAYAIAGDAYIALGDSAQAKAYFENAAKSSPEDSQILIRRAMAMIGSGEDEIGIKELGAALELSKSVSQADEYLVMSLLSQQKLAEAEEAVQKLEKRAPGHPMTLNLKGIVLLAEADRTGALNAFEAAIKRDPAFLPATTNAVQLDLEAGAVDIARKRLEAAVAAEKKPVDQLMALAEFEFKLGNMAATRSAWERAAAADREAVSPRKRLVSAYLHDGDVGKALETAMELMTLQPNDPEVIMLAALAQQRSGNQNQARETITQLKSLFPDDDLAALKVAEFQTGAGLAVDAETTLRESLADKPRSAPLQIGLTSLLIGQRRYADAIEFAQTVQARQPKAPVGFLLEGEVLEAEGEFEKAVDLYRKGLALQPTGQIAAKIYIARSKAGDAAQALAELQTWVEGHKDDKVARQMLGDALLAAGEYQRASEQYELIVESGSASIDVLNGLANAYLLAGDKRALDIAKAAYQAAPDAALIVDTLGWILFENGQQEEGLAFIRRAAALAPDEPEIRYHLAVALAATGDKDAARSVLDTLVNASFDFPLKRRATELRASLD